MNDTKHETKQNASHTPGPLEITTDTSAIEICTLYGLTRRSTQDGLGQDFVAIRKAGVRFHLSTTEEQDANALLIAAAPGLLEAAEKVVDRFAWIIDTVSRAVSQMNADDMPQEAIELLDEITSSEYFKDDIEQVQQAIAEAKGLAA